MNVYGVKAERGARVEDFLNDKLQTSADLATIDDLLEGVKKQQGLLEQQVSCHHIIQVLGSHWSS